ncbi:MAG: DUF488 domain-containing protein [Eubacteriales bacterium]|nr:DUF488 domain-containing protein [Eubacteriales bacterium]
MYSISCKRVYDEPDINDGKRILVDRLWPRGLKKEIAKLDFWAKDMTPSTDLRKWFSHDPDKYDAFSAQYTIELDNNPSADSFIESLRNTLKTEPVTFLYAAKDTTNNHANVLKNWVYKRLQQNKAE